MHTFKIAAHKRRTGIDHELSDSKKLRKRQYLLREGDVCKVVAFVEKGSLHLYYVNEDGSECVVAFAL